MIVPNPQSKNMVETYSAWPSKYFRSPENGSWKCYALFNTRIKKEVWNL